MTIKRLSSLMMFLGFVLFSYALANAQETKTTTTTSTNSRVVVTDNLAKPATTAAETAKPATSTTKIGKYSVNVTEGVTATAAPSPQSGKFYNMTKWDGTKWVTSRVFVANKPTATKPN